MSTLDSVSHRFRPGVSLGPRASRRQRRPAVDLLEGRQLLASSLTATSVPISPAPVEGQSFTSEVASFTDSDGNKDPGQYVAEINWGNGNSSPGMITAITNPQTGAVTFAVSGTYTFPEEGPFRVSVQIADKDNDTASVQTTNIVSDASLAASAVIVNATRGKALSKVEVAKFTDADPNGKASDFDATINWGDGSSTSNGVVVADRSGGFDVLGSHTYTRSGQFTVKVQINDGGPGVVSPQFYTPSNLISDGAVPADHINANLVNPWGIVATSMSPFWVANNGSGVSTLNDGSGDPNPLIVTIPGPKGSPSTFTAAPTGIVAPSNGKIGPPSELNVDKNGGPNAPAAFIFDTEDGTISAWNPRSTGGPNHAVLEVDNSTQIYPNGGVGAVYKGLALDNNGTTGINGITGDFLYATNFRSGNVDVFDSNFNPVALPAGAFHDPTIPAGYAPFGIQNIGGNLYVTFALQNSQMHDDVAGAGHGFVDVFSPTGVLMQRLGDPSGGALGPLEFNSPWGVVQAPSNFGQFSNDILVGNFGDSHISAFNPTTGAFLGQISDAQGHPITFTGGFQGPSVKGLWGLSFGNGGAAGPSNTLFFNSGINDESDGLFGSVTATSVGTATASSVASVSAAHAHGRTGTVAAQVNSTSSLLVPTTTADVSAFLGTVQDQHGHAHVDAALESLQEG